MFATNVTETSRFRPPLQSIPGAVAEATRLDRFYKQDHADVVM